MSKSIHFKNNHLIGSMFISQNNHIIYDFDLKILSLSFIGMNSTLNLHIMSSFKIDDTYDHLNLYENIFTSNVFKIDGDTIIINTLNNNSTNPFTHKNIYNGIFKIKLNTNGMNKFAKWFNKFYAVV